MTNKPTGSKQVTKQSQGSGELSLLILLKQNPFYFENIRGYILLINIFGKQTVLKLLSIGLVLNLHKVAEHQKGL